MTPDFLRFYELHERHLDGTPQQAAWVVWQALQSPEGPKLVAEARLEAAHEDGSGVPPVKERAEIEGVDVGCPAEAPLFTEEEMIERAVAEVRAGNQKWLLLWENMLEENGKEVRETGCLGSKNMEPTIRGLVYRNGFLEDAKQNVERQFKRLLEKKAEVTRG